MTSLGRVISVRGSLARVGLLAGKMGVSEVRATVGRFVSIRCANSAIIAMITEVSCENLGSDAYVATASVDLLGEILGTPDRPKFQRGVTNYPTIGDAVDLITNQELRTVYAPSGSDQIDVGTLQQDPSVTAYVDIEEMLSKHFAVLGSTGVGKSTGVSLLLNEILKSRPNLRIFLLDVHNEYGRCFGDRSLVLNPRNLKLPFWLFNFEEIVDVLFAGRPGVPDELDVLAEVIPVAKGMYTQYQNGDRLGLKRSEGKTVGYTVDTPVPYRLVDLISLIDERMGKLENRSSRIVYHKLISRIDTVRNDPRYTFMFDNANVGGDTMAEVISHLFRLPANGRPMTVMQLAGFPAEVIDSVVSVMCRMAFDFGLWSDGVSPLLFVCEEAHRYASADRSIGFGPTRKAVSRIAKEGRKYGVYLGLVTQRPAELDATIISQCNTLFTMRLANERDQALLRSAVSDAAANLLVLRALARHPRGAGVRRRRGAADPAALQGSAAASIAAQRSHHRHRAVGRRRPRHAFRRRGAGALARRHLEPRHSQRSRHQRPLHRAPDVGGSADAAAVDGPRSRPLFAAEEAAALRVLGRAPSGLFVRSPEIPAPSLRAQRSNPFFLWAATWIASLRSQ